MLWKNKSLIHCNCKWNKIPSSSPSLSVTFSLFTWLHVWVLYHVDVKSVNKKFLYFNNEKNSYCIVPRYDIQKGMETFLWAFDELHFNEINYLLNFCSSVIDFFFSLLINYVFLCELSFKKSLFCCTLFGLIAVMIMKISCIIRVSLFYLNL